MRNKTQNDLLRISITSTTSHKANAVMPINIIIYDMVWMLSISIFNSSFLKIGWEVSLLVIYFFLHFLACWYIFSSFIIHFFFISDQASSSPIVSLSGSVVYWSISLSLCLSFCLICSLFSLPDSNNRFLIFTFVLFNFKLTSVLSK